MKGFDFKRIVYLTLLCSVLGSVSLYASWNPQAFSAYEYPSQEKINRQVDSVLRKLSTREKIAQIMVINIKSDDSKEKKAIQDRLVKKEKIGGLIPLGNDLIVPAVKRVNQLNKWAKIPMLMTLDAEWGVSMRWLDAPVYPRFIQMGALSCDSLVYEVGKSIGEECRALKIQVNFSPDVDINNNPERYIVNSRAFGEEKEKVAEYAIAMMRGLRDGGVAGSAKHFPGHGDTDVDSHLALPVLPYSTERLDSLELYPFKRLIEDGVDMVMVAHLSIPALDPTGTPSSISKPIVTGLLREKLGYDGIICTDALDMNGVAKESGLAKKDIPLAAYKAGVDILLMPEDVENAITVIEQALKRGEITMEGLDMRVKKMLALKARFGLFDKGYNPIVDVEKLNLFTDQELKGGQMEPKMNLIKDVAKQTMTVVFNDNSAGYGLPLSLEGKKVAYVGFKNLQLGYEFGVIANRYGQVDTVLLGDGASLAELKDARDKLRNHDLVIMGINETNQLGFRNFGIVPEEMDFITDWAAEQPVIAVYLGSPYALARIQDHKNFTAFVVGYMNNQVNNFAAAQVVFGGIPAKGVLPVTSASFKAGESVIIPDRYREEYHEFVGTRQDSLNSVLYDYNEKSAIFTLLPQVAELVAGGKIKLDQTVGQLLDIDGADKSVTVEELLLGWKGNGSNLHYLQALLGKYRGYATVEEVATQMFAKIGMNSTGFSGKSADGRAVSSVISNGIDYNKYLFTLKNGGKYAGKQVLSPSAARLVLELMQ